MLWNDTTSGRVSQTSQLFFSLMNVWVKKLNSLDPPVPAFESITWICCIMYMFIVKVPDPILGPKGVRLLLAARGFFGFFGLFGVYYSLQYLSLSDATVLTFLAPMCTAITGAVLLHEPFSWREALAGLASLLGVVLIARPEFLFGKQHHTVGDVSAVTPAQRVGAVGWVYIIFMSAVDSSEYTSIRAVGKRAHPLHNLVSFSSQCVIVATLAMIIMRTPVVVPMRWDWLLMLLLIGLFGFVAQVLLTMGLQRETAGRGTMAVYIQIIFATIFERVFFHTSPSFLSVVGTLIILTSAIYVALIKARSTQDTHGQAEGAVAGDDPSVEEGLLANHTDEPSQESKDVELTSVTVAPPERLDGRDEDSDLTKA
ncbi:DUF6-domain-containing protein [Trametes coccinea BRFM310]|uniref:DUF6-domain-containing protein n=1 Tax=Trametes coccinea (strain BRFM310) TaxID=1353009 RepID=A0A1Y2I9G1_TRAC3|nr:DUF6-domain-containing protein [Trametes coccinea BRFM310]